MTSRCEYPFRSIAIQPNGDITPCCAYTGRLEKFSNIDSVTQFLSSNQQLAQLKLNETNDLKTLPGCNKCYSNSNLNASRKYMFKKSVAKYSNKNKDSIEHLDISFGNLCNLSCAMCSSKYSSKLRNIELDFSDRWFDVAEIFNLNTADLDNILDACPDVKVIELKGGEPLMYPEMLEYFLNKAYNIYGESLKVYITTNFTKITPKVSKIIKKFQNVKLIISIDGVGDTYYWIRGFDFDQFDKLIRTQGAELSGSIERFNFCSSIFNLGNIQDFYNWSLNLSESLHLNKQIPTSFSIISRDEQSSVLLTPRKHEAKEIVNQLLRDSVDCAFTNNSLKVLDSYLDNCTIESTESIEKFYKWFNHIDSIRPVGLPDRSTYFFPRLT